MGTAVSKLKKSKGGLTKESVTSAVASEIGKNLTEKSAEISETIASKVVEVAPQVVGNKDTIKSGVETALKTVSSELQKVTSQPANEGGDSNESKPLKESVNEESVSETIVPQPEKPKDEAKPGVEDTLKKLTGLSKESITSAMASGIGKNLTEKSAEISESIASKVVEVAPQVMGKKDTIKSGVETALKTVSSELSKVTSQPASEGGDSSESKLTEESGKKDSVSETISDLVPQLEKPNVSAKTDVGDAFKKLTGLNKESITSVVANEIDKNLTEKSAEISESIASKVVEVAPQVVGNKDTIKSGVETALKTVSSELQKVTAQPANEGGDSNESKPTEESSNEESVSETISDLVEQLEKPKDEAKTDVEDALKLLTGLNEESITSAVATEITENLAPHSAITGSIDQ